MKNLVLVGATLLTAASAQASVLVNETFSYPNGNLVGNGGWAAHSGAGAVPLQVLGGQAVTSQGGLTREDANTPFAPIGAGTTLFASFDFTNTGGNGTVYFAHFITGTSTFRARVFIAAGAGDYTLGISDTATLAAAGTWASGLTFGTTYKAVISYEFDTGDTTLWVNPVDELSTSISVPGTASTALAGFAIRQANPSAGTNSQTLDNLIVGTSFADVIPAPGSLALLGLGGLVAARRRR